MVIHHSALLSPATGENTAVASFLSNICNLNFFRVTAHVPEPRKTNGKKTVLYYNLQMFAVYRRR
jgi:hypothetical protein